MNIVADVYEYIACLADDVTILNMLSVNKKFLDENYYRRIIEKKHPHLVKLKSDKPYVIVQSSLERRDVLTYNYAMCWRKFYIKNIYFMLKFEEIFKVPYFTIKPFFFPEALLDRLFRDQERNPHRYLLGKALSQGKVDISNLILKKKLCELSNLHLSSACRSGNLNLIKEVYDILKGTEKRLNVMTAIFVTINEGNFQILNFLLEKVNYDQRHLNCALSRSSIFRESDDVMKYLIAKGANNFSECITILLDRINKSESYLNKLEAKHIESYSKYISSLQDKLKFLQSFPHL
jgi:hypothetical protein